jgi:hypothetical protein
MRGRFDEALSPLDQGHVRGRQPSAGNQSSTYVSYWDATKSAGARHARIDYPTLSRALFRGGKRACR